jgi:hypothetical protein
MSISDIEQQAANLKKGQKLEAYISNTEDKPYYITIGNGKTSKSFKQDVVMDAMAVFASLSPKQQEVVLLLRDEMIRNQINAFQSKTQLDNPNEIHLSHTTTNETAEKIKSLLRANGNGKALNDKKVLRKVKPKVYMLNPFMFIPAYKFAETVAKWNAAEKTKTKEPEDTTPQLDQSS